MKQTTYREMPCLLSRELPFKGNSVTAVEIEGKNTLTYRVYSYNTVMFEKTYFFGSGTTEIHFNNRYYSMTTSKIQNMLIDVYGLNNGIRKRD